MINSFFSFFKTNICPKKKMNPQMKYKMIVLNLDGTLTNDNKEITGETVFNQVLEPSLFPLLHKEAVEAGMEILTYQGEAIAASRGKNKYVLHEAFNKMPVIEYEDFLSQVRHPVNKCLIVGDPKPLLKKYRRYAVVILLVLSAIITPSGDPFTLAVVFLPIYLLYEFSILLVRKG